MFYSSIIGSLLDHLCVTDAKSVHMCRCTSTTFRKQHTYIDLKSLLLVSFIGVFYRYTRGKNILPKFVLARHKKGETQKKN